MVWVEPTRISTKDRHDFTVLEDVTFFVLEHRTPSQLFYGEEENVSSIVDQYCYRILMRTREEFHLIALSQSLPKIRREHWIWLKDEINSKVKGKFCFYYIFFDWITLFN